jgi:hypothetical protein
MNSLTVSAIEILGEFKYSEFLLQFMLMIGVLFAGLAISVTHDILVNARNKKNILITSSTFFLSLFVIISCLNLMKAVTLPENTCFTKVYRNLKKFDESKGIEYQKKVSELTEAITIGQNFNVSNINDLIESKQKYEKLMAEWNEAKKNEQKSKKSEFFVAKVSNNKMTVISEEKTLNLGLTLRIALEYSFKQVACSPKMVQAVNELQQEKIIGFNR